MYLLNQQLNKNGLSNLNFYHQSFFKADKRFRFYLYTDDLQVRLRKFKCNLLSCQFLVDCRVSFGLVFDVGLLIFIQMNLEQTGAIKTESNPLSNNFCGVHEVIEDSTVNSYQVRLRGRFCFCLFTFLVGFGRILLWAMKTTCLPENFFSNSRTNLV